MADTTREAPCMACGMPCKPGEFHPFAACLMFKGCHDSTVVRANLNALATPEQAPAVQAGARLPRHKFWGAGEPGCPPELKAPNGELHTTRCKVCGDGWRKSRDVCLAALRPGPVAEALEWVDDFIARCNGDDRGACEAVNVLRAALATTPAVQAEQPAEPVLWQYRVCYSDNTVTPGWGDWQEVKPRNAYTNTVQDTVREIQGYIDQGKPYQLRALYAAPRGQAEDAQRLADEQLADALFAVLRRHNDNRAWRALTYESGPYDVTCASRLLIDLGRAAIDAARASDARKDGAA